MKPDKYYIKLYAASGFEDGQSCSLLGQVCAPGLVNFITAVAYHLCPSLPAAFTQPGASTLADLCREWIFGKQCNYLGHRLKVVVHTALSYFIFFAMTFRFRRLKFYTDR